MRKTTTNEEKLSRYLAERVKLTEDYLRSIRQHSDRQGELCRKLTAATAKALKIEVKLYGAAT